MAMPLPHGQNRGVYSSRKSELLPSAKRRLGNSSPIFLQLQKLQVHFNQGRRSVFDMGGWFYVVLGGMCPTQKLENFVFFETRIVQFDGYFWVQN